MNRKTHAKLAEYLEREQMSQEQFAEIVGVTQGAVHQWVTGKKAISAEAARNIEIGTHGGLTRCDCRPDLFGPLVLSP